MCTVEGCGETREKQNTMHYHLQKHEGTGKYKCNVTGCDKTFYQKYALDDHCKLSHSIEPAEASIHCPFDTCQKKFHKKEHCRVHIARNHLKEYLAPWIVKSDTSTVHTCGNCKKECNSYSSILYHVMDHAKQTNDPILKAKLLII